MSKTAQAVYEEGQNLQRTGGWDKALEKFDAAIKVDSKFLPAYYAACDVYAGLGYKPHALNYLVAALEACPGEREVIEKFVDTVAGSAFRVGVPAYRKILADSFSLDAIDYSRIESAWRTMLLTDPEFGPIYKALTKRDWAAAREAFDALPSKKALTDVFFLEGLKRIKLADAGFELFLTRLRRLLLEDDLREEHHRLGDEPRSRIAQALGQACFFTDYLFDVTGEEQKAVEALRAAVESKPRAQDVAVLSCYLPLHELANAQGLLTKFRKGELAALVRLQIGDVLEQRAIAQGLPSLTAIEDAVSQNVRAQYEESPYPKWLSLSKRNFDQVHEGHLREGNPKVLVAGCGTGKEACELAAAIPNADILAVDLSRASLSYAAHRARALGLTNLRFAQADILELGVLEDRFDFIACSGVLHHMDDPFKGWQVIAGLLKEGCVMRVCLYSEIARKPIVEARKVIADKGYASDPEGIRRFRRDAPKLLKKKSFEKIAQARDYFSLPECRDLLFHVQEHRFTCAMIQDHLARLGLSFEGFMAGQKTMRAYRKKFRKDPEGKNLGNWAKFEKKNPDTFIAMYQFWCRKD